MSEEIKANEPSTTVEIRRGDIMRFDLEKQAWFPILSEDHPAIATYVGPNVSVESRIGLRSHDGGLTEIARFTKR